MYLYQNFLTLAADKERKEKLKTKSFENRKYETSISFPAEQKEFQNILKEDKIPASKSFNPICQTCKSQLCISAFNYDFHKNYSKCKKI